MSQLKHYYEKEVIPKLMETFKYQNIMEVPKLEKIVLNMGLGEAIHNIKLLDSAREELKLISGQHLFFFICFVYFIVTTQGFRLKAID